MNKGYPVITSMGHYFPDYVLDNKFFESLDIGSAADWIESRTGIRERRSSLSPDDIRDIRWGRTTVSQLRKLGRVPTLGQLAKPAWGMALERRGSGFDPQKIDLVTGCTSTPDWDLPANACAVAGEIGINAPGFDINSACSAFIANLHFIKPMMETGRCKTSVIFHPERLTTRIDYSDRAGCILFGDTAAAAIVEYQDKPKGLALMDTVVYSSPADYLTVQLPEGGYFNQNGAAVQKFAITRTVEVTRDILQRNQLTTDDVTYFVSHQANLRMLMSAVEKLNLPPEKHLYNVDIRGNQGCAGAPTTLSENWDKFKPGDVVVVSVVGAGLTWAAALFRVY